MTSEWIRCDDCDGLAEIDACYVLCPDCDKHSSDVTIARLADIDRLRAEVERLSRERDEARKRLVECETCSGSGVMSVLQDVLPPDGREVYADVECGECHGWGVGYVGQLEAERDRLRSEVERLSRGCDTCRHQGVDPLGQAYCHVVDDPDMPSAILCSTLGHRCGAWAAKEA